MRCVRVLGGLACCVVATVVLGGCAAPEGPGAGQTPLQAARSACSSVSLSSAKLGDEGYSLTLDMRGDDDQVGLAIESIDCILEALDVPDATKEKMRSTRALDGMQSASWGDITATWTYHPDSGLDVILELAQSR